jgi:pyruvate dehydrogenase E1 component
MFADRQDVFYYITLYNENYPMPAIPEGAEEGVLKGLYRLKEAPRGEGDRPRVHLLGSGSLLREAQRAQEILAERYGVAADLWSATSYKELRREALEAERWNLLHPDQEPRKPYVVRLFEGDDAPVVAVSDYLKLVPDQISRWLPGRLYSLGTDGFGRSETREALRRFFEVDAECVAVAALLALSGRIDRAVPRRAIDELGVDPEKLDPLAS